MAPSGQRTRELRAILAKARHDDPGQRYHSVGELGADLERWLERLPVLAIRGGWGYSLNCAVRRRPWLSLGSATAALLLLGLLIGFNWRLQVENARTERAAAIAENVNRFLTEDLLSQADPYNTPKPDLSVRELLDRARAGLGERFDGQPGIEAGIRATLARSYSGVGEYDVATQEYERAIQLAEASGEHEAEDLSALRAERADMRSRLGDVSAALAELKSLEEQERVRAGGDNRAQIRFALQAIEIQVAASQTEPALAAIALLQPRMAILAADDTLRIELLAAEGEAALRLAKFSQADRALKEAEVLAARMLGPDSPRLQGIIQNRAILYRQMGQLAPALELERRVLAWQEQRFGRLHPETQRTLNELASMLQDDRQFEAAEKLFREVLAEREDKLGVGSVLTRNSLNNLGLVLSLQNKLDEAEVHYRRALDVERELLGADAFDVLILAHNLAGLLRKRGELDAALDLSRDTVERAERTMSAERHEPALFRVGMAQTLQKLGRFAEARTEFLVARERLARLLGADHARITRLDEMLAALETERLAH
ncbi:MAG: tetratricopeptide repeat protein [Ahniella sp.]|nr:tetratricopeptide repeat protein [Ahniella sp.]